MRVVLQAWGVHWEATAAEPHRSLHALSVAALADHGSEASVAEHGVAAVLLAMWMYVAAPADAAAAAVRMRPASPCHSSLVRPLHLAKKVERARPPGRDEPV